MTGIRNMLLLAILFWIILYLAFHLKLFLLIAAVTYALTVLVAIAELLEKKKMNKTHPRFTYAALWFLLILVLSAFR